MVQKQQTVILCGNSLLLAGIEVCLSSRIELDVRRVEATALSDAQYLETLSPDVVIFDLTLPGNQLALNFLKRQPDLLLIGLDLDSSQAIVLSSRQQMSTRSDSLAELIQQNVARNTHNHHKKEV